MVSPYLQEVLSNPVVSNKQIFLLGDFILDLLRYVSHTGTGEFFNMLLSQQFLPNVMHPTRVSDNPSIIIDDIFASAFDQEIVSSTILPITDHFPQFLIVKHGCKAYETNHNLTMIFLSLILKDSKMTLQF